MQAQSLIASIVPLALLSSCFGDGPVPVQPDEATVLYSVPAIPGGDECNESRFVDGVAVGPNGLGYVLTAPYAPTNPCGGVLRAGPVAVESFSTSEKQVDQLGEAGSIDTPRRAARVSVSGDGPLWAYNIRNDAVKIDPKDVEITGLPPQASAVAGLTQDTEFIYLATWSEPNGGPEPVNSPNYPCCGPLFEDFIDPGAIRKINKADNVVQTLAVTPNFACETLDTCFVSNSADLFYVERPSAGTSVTINRYPKSGGTTTDVELLGEVFGAGTAGGPPMVGVVGLAATDSHVAWSESVQHLAQGFSDPISPPSCKITVLTLATGESEVVLNTANFSCAHATLDDTDVYFTIVDFDKESQSVHGVGVARVDLGSSNVESLDHGIAGRLGGPRRLYLEGDTMYLVASFAIASVKKTALDGRDDFNP